MYIIYVYAVYIFYVYINTQTCMYIFKKIGYVYILNIFIYNVCHVTLYANTSKCFLNIQYTVWVCIYIYIINIHRKLILDAINRCPALIYIYKYYTNICNFVVHVTVEV